MLGMGTMKTMGRNGTQDTRFTTTLLDYLLQSIPSLHALHERYNEIDQEIYTTFQHYVSDAPAITPHERAIIDEATCRDSPNSLPNSPTDPPSPASSSWKRISPSSSLVTCFQKTSGGATSGDGVHTIAKAVANIDAPANHVLAVTWCLNSYEQLDRHVMSEGEGALRRVLPVPDSHSQFYMNVVRVGMGISDRLFCTWWSWCQEEDGSYVIAFAPASEYQVRASAKSVRHRTS